VQLRRPSWVFPQATLSLSRTHARANFSELAEEVKGGAEKIITKNGESYMALIDANRLDYYHQIERERIHLLLLYALIGGAIYLLAIRHQRQLSFDFEGHWGR
jgi:hypothetical protein